ncbi:ABC transporter permease [Rhizobium sp. CC-YZS058]|uniref:ABC transporter permease n=1 Tax=Rhizobium sp. CC-YZS058 TaxID=3042153 RepID=UPI002B05A191|nr:ABC transporter permease [Rhizobium sp. CC-YZS058]MEA3533851.1 ABC transporter permease [Rhizobium sp. CC-YZS058]
MSAVDFILAGMLAAATPFLLAALGELVAERAGVLNLGVEGLMALGAVVAFIIVYHGGGHVLAFLAAGLAGVLLSLLFALVALGFRANQVATGLAIGILGQGLSALFGKSYESLTVKGLPKIALPGLSDLPVVGGLFSQDLVVWLSLALTLAIWAGFAFTKTGLVIRAVGENPNSAHAIGYSVQGVRLAAIAFGGLLAGFAGAYASVVYTPLWADGMIAGRGWIAIALVVFGTWLTGRIFLGACLFGAVSLMSLAAQATGVELPSQLLSSLPYLITIIVLGIISANKRLLKLNGVASLGEPFER